MPPHPGPASTRPPNTKAGLVPAIKRTSHACERCQILRVKCSGGERCQKCIQDSAECAYKDRKRERNKQIQVTLDKVLEQNELLRQRNQELLAALTKLSSVAELDPDQVSPVLELISKHESNTVPVSQSSSRSTPIKSNFSGAPQSTGSPSHAEPNGRTSNARPSRSSTMMSAAENEHIRQAFSPQADASGSWSSASSAPYVDIANMPHGIQNVQVGPVLRLSSMPTERHIIPKQEPMTPTSATMTGMTPNFNNAPPPFSPTHQYTFSSLPNTFSIPQHHTIPGPTFASASAALCRVYTDYRTSAQHHIASGQTPLSTIIGPDYVCVDLFFRARRPTDPQSVCNWASELAKSLTDLDIFVRLACTLLYTHLMRWMLDPSPENYARIPQLIRPTLAQIRVPHSPCVDLVPLPEMREALLEEYRDWLTPMMGLTLEWPYSMAQAVDVNPYTSCMCLTRSFERHVTEPANWVFTEAAVLDAFPELAGKVRVRTG